MDLNRIALPLAALAFFLLTMVWPSVRLYRTTGTFAVTFQRNSDPRQRWVGALFGLTLAGALGWAVVYGWLGPDRLGIAPPPSLLAAAAWLAMTAGLIVLLAAQVNMGASWRIGIDDRPTGLVTGGLFRFVRNPIFSAMLLMAAGMAALTPSFVSFGGWLVMAVLVRIQCHFEERHLLALHGEAYCDYASRVGRLIPGIGKLKA